MDSSRKQNRKSQYIILAYKFKTPTKSSFNTIYPVIEVRQMFRVVEKR